MEHFEYFLSTDYRYMGRRGMENFCDVIWWHFSVA